MAPFQTSSLTLGNIVASGKAKTVPLTGDCVWTPSDLTKVLWQPKGFNGEDTNRVAISFTSGPEAEQELLLLEQWILDVVGKEPKRFLGQELTPAQVKERFVSAVKVSEKGYKTIRAKMNFSGRQGVKCWDETKRPRELPEDWTMCTVAPRFQAKGLWVANKDFGLILEMTDAMVTEGSAECPF